MGGKAPSVEADESPLAELSRSGISGHFRCQLAKRSGQVERSPGSRSRADRESARILSEAAFEVIAQNAKGGIMGSVQAEFSGSRSAERVVPLVPLRRIRSAGIRW